MHAYLHGLDVTVLGARTKQTLVGAQPGAPAVVIRVKDVGALVKSQSPTGGVLYDLTPATMSNIVYGQMAKKMADGLKQQGVDADVQVLTLPSTGPAPKSDLFAGMLVGAALAGGGWALWHFIGRR